MRGAGERLGFSHFLRSPRRPYHSARSESDGTDYHFQTLVHADSFGFRELSGLQRTDRARTDEDQDRTDADEVRRRSYRFFVCP